jgi:hypothetical protein
MAGERATLEKLSVVQATPWMWARSCSRSSAERSIGRAVAATVEHHLADRPAAGPVALQHGRVWAISG